MAEIPIRQRSGGQWWLWLIGALIIAALLFWFLSGINDNDEITTAPVNPIEHVETAAVNDVAITDIATILAADRSELIGRPVQLKNVAVQSVMGDRTFYVGANEQQRVFVVLDQVPTPTTPTEGRYDVTAGQTIDVTGEMMRFEASMFEGQPIEDMPAATDVIIMARSLSIVDRS